MNEFDRLHADFSWKIHDYAKVTDELWLSNAPDSVRVSYPEDGHQHLQSLEAGSFWFEHRNNVIHAQLQSFLGRDDCLWEVGAGNGFVAQYLQKNLCQVVAVEPGRVGAQNCLQYGIPQVVCGLFEDLRLPEASLQAIGCFDVLEHLQNPEDLVQEFARTLRPGGILAVTVPAMPWLWSDSDKKAGHFRRFTRRSCRELITGFHFEVIQVRYFMAVFVPGVFLGRTLPTWLGRSLSEERLGKQLNPPSESFGKKLAQTLLNVEMGVQGIVPLPFGTSVIGVFRKLA